MNRSNPYQPSDEAASLDNSKIDSGHSVSLAVVLGIGFCVGIVVAVTAVFLGFHGNYAGAGLFVLGPTIWGIVAFTSNDAEYLVVVSIGSVLLFMTYAWFFYFGNILSQKLRLTCMFVFHVASAVTYQLTFGI